MILSMRVALVRGPSMVPTLRDGDRVVVRLGGAPRAGQVVLVELPGRPLSVKRLVELRSDGTARVEGDNPFASTDSRVLGALPAEVIKGTVVARLWPRPRLLR
ncbi:MAG TPA: S24/S26 family peptidase [Mycobacteriales bacterium]|nr:S24/S26 family peptidase [Mycobacteriales bacterium]